MLGFALLLQHARIDLRDFDQCLRRRAGLAAPCSQFWSVRTDTPSNPANCACDNPDFSRARTIGYEWTVNRRPATATKRTVARLSEQLRRYLDDQAWFEGRAS